MHNAHQNGARWGFFVKIGGQQQHFVEHIAAQSADCHHGNPCEQIGAGEATHAANQHQNNKEHGHNPHFFRRAPNQVVKLVFPVCQRGEYACVGVERGRLGWHGKALVYQGRDKGGKIAFGCCHAHNAYQRKDDAGFVGLDVAQQAHETLGVFFGE